MRLSYKIPKIFTFNILFRSSILHCYLKIQICKFLPLLLYILLSHSCTQIALKSNIMCNKMNCCVYFQITSKFLITFISVLKLLVEGSDIYSHRNISIVTIYLKQTKSFLSGVFRYAKVMSLSLSLSVFGISFPNFPLWCAFKLFSSSIRFSCFQISGTKKMTTTSLGRPLRYFSGNNIDKL